MKAWMTRDAVGFGYYNLYFREPDQREDENGDWGNENHSWRPHEIEPSLDFTLPGGPEIQQVEITIKKVWAGK